MVSQRQLKSLDNKSAHSTSGRESSDELISAHFHLISKGIEERLIYCVFYWWGKQEIMHMPPKKVLKGWAWKNDLNPLMRSDSSITGKVLHRSWVDLRVKRWCEWWKFQFRGELCLINTNIQVIFLLSEEHFCKAHTKTFSCLDCIV